MNLDELEESNGGKRKQEPKPKREPISQATRRRNPTGNGIHDQIDEWELLTEAYMHGERRDHFGFRLPHNRRANEHRDRDFDPYQYFDD